MLGCKYQSSMPPVSERKNFVVGLPCSYIPSCDPRRGQFLPQGHHIIEIYKDMLYTKYPSSRPSSFREEEFWNFLSLFLCSNLWPPRQAQFWPHGLQMNKHGRGPQREAIYQIRKLWAFKFQIRRILKFSFFVPMFQIVTSMAGHNMNKLCWGPQWDTTYQIWKL